MKQNVLIASFDMAVGGVERSLVSMLNAFDYDAFDVDVMLYSHTGDFMPLLPGKAHLLDEVCAYKTVRQPIAAVFKQGHWALGLRRLVAKFKAACYQTLTSLKEAGCLQIQYVWQLSIPCLPDVDRPYDVAISYLWPHYVVAEKVQAKTKIAWIHTDYSSLEIDETSDVRMWKKFDYIVSVSEACGAAFLRKYPALAPKLIQVENITAPAFVKERATEPCQDRMRDPHTFMIVSVGRLCYPKAFDQAVLILEALHKKGLLNIKWYVVGYGPDQALLERMIAQSHLQSSFILLGKKINPYPYMAACDLYVQPSRYEGKAVTVTEAKILAKPVLIANYPTAASQITDGVDGVVCDGAVMSMAQAIEALYYDEARRRALSAYCARQNYSNAAELDNLYRVMR